jgi:acetyltransferase-like isoleucine patch superfamily enzyme
MKKKYSFIVRAKRFLHFYVSNAVRMYYNWVWGTHIGKGSRISLSAKIDSSNPQGVHIGEYTTVTFRCSILTHDFPNGIHRDVHIGSYCFIGCGAVILPGVTIGDHCIIAANAMVVKDIPANCVAIGNPAFVVERDVKTTKWGRRIDKLGS